MALFSWLPSLSSGSKDHNDAPDFVENMDFEILADQVQELRAKFDWALGMCEQANSQFDQYRTEIFELKKSLDAERSFFAKANRLLEKTRKVNEQLENQSRKLQASLRRETVLNSQLQARFNTEMASLRAMTKYARTQEEKLIDTQLDLEFLKCTTDAEPLSTAAAGPIDNDAPLPAQPFVVVLIDGDAYKWAPDIPLNDIHLGTGSANSNPDGSGPGADAATRIRNEVTKYILNHNGTIPVTAKIVTRGFCNFAGEPGLRKTWRQNGHSSDSLAEFAMQFTEKLPLFDFFDAGRGKERADDKIRENFHLFLSTPNCHAIFVAACLDNGFTRMLEPYSDHPLARQKIVLVSPGYIALEMRRLCLTEVQWPSVFAHRQAPPDVVAKAEREKTRVKQVKARALLHRTVSMPVASGNADTTGANEILPRLLDMVPAWNVDAAMNKSARGVGFRSPLKETSMLDHLDLAAVREVIEEVD